MIIEFKKILKDLCGYIINPKKAICDFEFYKLSKMSRYQKTKIRLFGKEIELIDAKSFISAYKEIFLNQIYKFSSDKDSPLIIDAGANIGLSVIYFKKLYPNCRIIAFEPDNAIFFILKNNIKSFGLSGINLINAGLSDKAGEADFYSEGADAGRITQNRKEINSKINAVKLSDYLNKEIDLLKMDIEGAEFDVINECKDYLNNVKNIFLEYHSFENKPQILNKILDILSNSGFRYYICNSGILKSSPFVSNKTNLGMDLQLNIFAYRN